MKYSSYNSKFNSYLRQSLDIQPSTDEEVDYDKLMLMSLVLNVQEVRSRLDFFKWIVVANIIASIIFWIWLIVAVPK